MSPLLTNKSACAEGPAVATRIGEARPSHLMTTAGVGAVVDLPAMSVMVRGLDTWNPIYQAEIIEPRLLERVQRVLGPQVRALRKAPWDAKESENAWTRVGVPVTPFPGWLRCPACHRLGPLGGSGQFELVHRWGKRADLAKYVHKHCDKQGRTTINKRRACIPARFVVVCEDGHIDDFPFVPFVHRNATKPCHGPRLTMRDAASTLGPQVTVVCLECDERGNIMDASGRDGWENLPRCRGRHPHLQQFSPCGKNLRLMVLGASNLWFSVSASALHLPSGKSVPELVAKNWEILSAQPSPEIVDLLIGKVEDLRELREADISVVWTAIQEIRSSGGPSTARPDESLLDAEWRLLSHPTTEKQDDDFRAVPTPKPSGYDQLLHQVVLVPRLRETSALLGFTRISAPGRQDLDPIQRVPLTRGKPKWVPAADRRGEGIFLELREDAVRSWARQAEQNDRIIRLRRAYDQWLFNRSLPADPSFPVARFLLLHTLSHLLIRQVALECGYSSASIRERLYLGAPNNPAAGILLSTSASDSEGTLGGLVSLGEKRYLQRLLDQAFEDAAYCSSDPLCAEHVPEDPSAALHAAACHACLFASETTCEVNNRWLDRAVLVDLTSDGLAFPR
ncbi:DrmB family protein [Streptomyces cucumeris]|uniref:DrmB family protein n=1 Tax=Streptomyces cucumeris TaxID=2962890 RepID=UPI003EB73B5F